MLSQKSMLLPVMFDTRTRTHGRGFVRFAEELNGAGCFGTSIFRSLAGAGYALYWSTAISSPPGGRAASQRASDAWLYATTAATERTIAGLRSALHADVLSHGASVSALTSCSCCNSEDPNKLFEMVKHFNRSLPSGTVSRLQLQLVYHEYCCMNNFFLYADSI